MLQNLCGTIVWRHDNPVVHPLAITPGGHNAGVPQVSEMSRNLRLRLIEYLHEVADAEFLVSHQVQEPEPRVVSQRLEESLEIEVFCLRRHEYDYIRIDESVQLGI